MVGTCSTILIPAPANRLGQIGVRLVQWHTVPNFQGALFFSYSIMYSLVPQDSPANRPPDAGRTGVLFAAGLYGPLWAIGYARATSHERVKTKLPTKIVIPGTIASNFDHRSILFIYRFCSTIPVSCSAVLPAKPGRLCA